jgi:hypothetical protein
VSWDGIRLLCERSSLRFPHLELVTEDCKGGKHLMWMDTALGFTSRVLAWNDAAH